MGKSSTTITMGQRVVVTIPKKVRENYRLEEGDELTLLAMEGVLLLKPGHSEIDEMAERLGRALKGRGESLEGMLTMVREQREQYGKRSSRVR
ncbi:MAG: SpoVT / AbrB like domain protein [Verrucomicrobia bacterium ADurb.Bin345]|nr:MAG: SpoVT / AbrB like domain protein [Verrucomicrobia bacterium ADurb.Bin345]